MLEFTAFLFSEMLISGIVFGNMYRYFFSGCKKESGVIA
jgi:hypothetical protein